MDFPAIINSVMQQINIISNTAVNTTFGGLLILMTIGFTVGLLIGRNRR